MNAVMGDAKPHFRITRLDIGVNLPARPANPVEFAVAQKLAVTAQADSFMLFSVSFHSHPPPKTASPALLLFSKSVILAVSI